ncbi:MAG: hypothetical protein ACREDC_02510, partial [Bradyrhizobium sp.]
VTRIMISSENRYTFFRTMLWCAVPETVFASAGTPPLEAELLSKSPALRKAWTYSERWMLSTR